MTRAFLPLSFALLFACGNDRLSRDNVTNLPAGDATGDAFSGVYETEALTTSCRGDCRGGVDGVIISACDIGTRMSDDSIVAQTDGVLIVDVESNDYVSRLEGGVNADGSFEVGGFRTVLGGRISSAGILTGQFSGGSLTGEIDLAVDGSGFDCLITAEVSGTLDN